MSDDPAGTPRPQPDRPQDAGSGRAGRTGRAPLTSARSKARREALDILFEAEQRSIDPAEMLAARQQLPARENPPRAFTGQIVLGVARHAAAIDDLIATYSQGWALSRMPAVDRAALRIGVWEIVFHDDTPDGVAVSEAVALVTALSTGESPGFVNGLLSRIADIKPSLS